MRLWDDVPADLALRAQWVTPGGRRVFGTTVRLADVTDGFNAGLPPYGSDSTVTVAIPTYVSDDTILQIEFRHDKNTKRIKRDDGLARIEWERWIKS